jgi:uncharacterized protein (DUF1800 family)
MKILIKNLIFPILFIAVLVPSSVLSQIYQDHFGTGNSTGITVTSSDESNTNDGKKTLTGTGYFPDMAGASRFLAQASLGANYEEIEHVTSVGIENWIEEQMTMPIVPYIQKSQTILEEINQQIQQVHPGLEMDRLGEVSSITLYRSLFEDADVLRNKTAFSLLQILVVSRASIVLGNQLKGHMSYLDILYEGAFDNYRNLLESVTLHPMMGYYLSHLQNKKGDPSIGTLPDENYAREIMQLFSIGLFELNIDGTYKLDFDGNRIPTYDINDVQELAKVFTGLSGGAWDLKLFPELEGVPLDFDRRLNRYDITVPMIMYEEHHDQGEKTLPDGTVLPAGQSGMKDIQDVLDVLFNHPNIGPFVTKRMIQQMIKSNPSPAYVKKVALTFNNNGEGVRGDMGAVVKAILLDPEARDCNLIDDEKNGKLRQPIERLVQLFKAFDIEAPSGNVWFVDRVQIEEQLGQAFMASPSVFNFFTPFYAEDEFVAPNDMVSPEFQILHAVTAINYLNMAEDAIKDSPFRNRTEVNNNNPRLKFNNQDDPVLDFSDELTIYQTQGLSALLERLNLLLCHGQLSESTKNIIQGALQQMENEGGFSPRDILDNALYFIMVSPDYIILE